MKNLLKLSLISLGFLAATLVRAEDPQLLISQAAQDADYILCIDGGASNTQLRVLNLWGEELELYEEGFRSGTMIETTGSNRNKVGEEGIMQAFQALFGGLGFDSGNGIGVPFASVASRCAIVAGITGVSSAENREHVLNVLEEQSGIPRERIALFSDIELALELVGEQGAVVIAGMGSVCFAKVDGESKRSGGLGHLLGDKAGADAIAFDAVRQALAEEYGWGEPTSLTARAKAFFGSEELTSLVPAIHSGELTNDQIAEFCPVVFDEARQGDYVSQKIVNSSANYLGDMLSRVMEDVYEGEFPVVFIGGVFKDADADAYIQSILDVPSIRSMDEDIEVIPQNMARTSFIPEVVRNTLAL
tara:strand:- start:1032 stop:2114 length:1083 start_codon:yes stop_codon:yes gene_type:complete